MRRIILAAALALGGSWLSAGAQDAPNGFKQDTRPCQGKSWRRRAKNYA